MNKVLLQLIAFVLFSTNVFAQIPKLDHIKNLKESKVIIGLSGNSHINKNLEEIVKSNWKLCDIDSSLPYEEALKKASENENLFVVYIGSITSRSFKHSLGDNWDFRFISKGKFVGLSNGRKRPLMRSYIPTYNHVVTNESITHGLNFMQTLFTSMLNKNEGARAIVKLYKKEAHKLANKTLYIPKDWIHKKLTEEVIAKTYGSSNFKIVDYEVWKDAIINKKEGIAYVILIPYPIQGDYVYQHHIFDSATNQLYAISQPGAAIKMNKINLSKANTGYITKKNIKKYKGVLSGKW